MPNLLNLVALDFDGVICNGLNEYFQTSWRAYCQIWPDTQSIPPDHLAASFYRLRPVVETGWEMPIVLRALMLGYSESEILADWPPLAAAVIQLEQLNSKHVGHLLDQVRDRWIATDRSGWLAAHQFYPGVVEYLQTLTYFVIISTKEGRFIQQLLGQQGLALSQEQILGKEQQRSKADLLRDLRVTYDTIWFVEDRLQTLETVSRQADLSQVQLFLADWGYNLPAERQQAQHSDRIRLLSLGELTQGLAWPSS
jgi:phosphoglycolate phosphatase-like HAD superfamily hydrolase